MLFLKKFIAGVVFATVAAPILDSLTSVILTGLEVVKGKWTIKITECNQQIQKIGEEVGTGLVHAIGFAAPAEEDDYEDD